MELTALALVASVTPIDLGLSEFEFSREMDRSGYTGVAANISIRRLLVSEIVERFEAENYNEESYFAYRPTSQGWKFLDKNISWFKMKKVKPKDFSQDLDDKIPF